MINVTAKQVARAKRAAERQMGRMFDVLAQSPRFALECEEKAAAEGKPIPYPPSTFGLGPMLPFTSPTTGKTAYKGTHHCTEAECRAAEALVLASDNPEWAGRIMFFRHTKYGCTHPDGALGELFGDLIRMQDAPARV